MAAAGVAMRIGPGAMAGIALLAGFVAGILHMLTGLLLLRRTVGLLRCRHEELPLLCLDEYARTDTETR